VIPFSSLELTQLEPPSIMRSLFRSLVVAAAASMAVAQSTFTNPIIWEDFADLDVFRVNDTFYYSASTMHYSPGAPVLRSYDLVNWEFAGHSVPRLDWGNKYNLPSGSSAYVNGIWASSMRYRKSNGRYYWYGCSDFATTWVYTATDPAGEWSLHGKIGKCFYDLGILVDNDDKIYLAYGSYDINVVELASDGLTIVRDQVRDSPVLLLLLQYIANNGNRSSIPGMAATSRVLASTTSETSTTSGSPSPPMNSTFSRPATHGVLIPRTPSLSICNRPFPPPAHLTKEPSSIHPMEPGTT
jgi:hypothetical protein